MQLDQLLQEYWSADVIVFRAHDRCRRIGNALNIYLPAMALPRRFPVAVLLAVYELAFGIPKDLPPTSGPSQLFIWRTLKASETM